MSSPLTRASRKFGVAGDNAYWLVRKPRPIASNVVAPEMPDVVASGSRRVADTSPAGIPAAEGKQVLLVRGLRTAEKLLDDLVERGIGEGELCVLGPAAFAVRWRDCSLASSKC